MQPKWWLIPNPPTLLRHTMKLQSGSKGKFEHIKKPSLSLLLLLSFFQGQCALQHNCCRTHQHHEIIRGSDAFDSSGGNLTLSV
ncbi:hypothetical protein YC2023_118058 [Brassica napus]